MALPRKGLRGVEKTAETTAWTNSMAESGGARVRDHSKTHSCPLNQTFGPECSHDIVGTASEKRGFFNIPPVLIIIKEGGTVRSGVVQQRGDSACSKCVHKGWRKDTRHSEGLSKGVEG